MTPQATDYIKKLYLAKVSSVNIIAFVQKIYNVSEYDIADVIINYYLLETKGKTR